MTRDVAVLLIPMQNGHRQIIAIERPETVTSNSGKTVSCAYLIYNVVIRGLFLWLRVRTSGALELVPHLPIQITS